MTARKVVALTKTSGPTATRELVDLAQKDLLVPRGEGRSRRYDLTTSGPQKFHAVSTPRVGGVAIAAALAASVLALQELDLPSAKAAGALTQHPNGPE